MNISIILAHPNKESFNHAIAQTTQQALLSRGHNTFFHDLYDEKFDPLLPYEEFEKNAWLSEDIKTYCDEISTSDSIVIIHPNWWGQPPAILKGWVDRVFRPGLVYTFLEGDSGEGIPIGLLKANTAMIFNTSNTPLEREFKDFGDPLQILWKTCIFGLCGIKTFYREMFAVIVTSTLEQRRLWLEQVEQIITQYFP